MGPRSFTVSPKVTVVIANGRVDERAVAEAATSGTRGLFIGFSVAGPDEVDGRVAFQGRLTRTAVTRAVLDIGRNGVRAGTCMRGPVYQRVGTCVTRGRSEGVVVGAAPSEAGAVATPSPSPNRGGIASPGRGVVPSRPCSCCTSIA